MSADGGSMLFILRFAVTHSWEPFVLSENTTSEPYSILLHHILFHFNLDRLWLLACHLLIRIQPSVHPMLDQLIKFGVKSIKQSASSRKNNVAVKLSSVVHRTRLDGIVAHFIERSFPVLMDELRVEEHLRP